jgi:hypothetical protein
VSSPFGEGRISRVRRRSVVVVLVVALLVSTVGFAADGPLVGPGAKALAESVGALTTPAMNGRRSGTEGGERAAALIAGWLRGAGLQPGGDNGSFLQSFVLSSGTRLAPQNWLDSNGAVFAVSTDWMPHGGSADGEVAAEVVFVGYGISAPDQSYDDYAGVDVNGRIALALAGAPDRLGGRVPRVEKLVAAREHGARALLLVDDPLPELSATSTSSPLPSASVRPAVANALLPGGETVAALSVRPRSFTTGHRARIRIALERVDVRAANVIGILPGRDPALAAETVVVGAHYDHLGLVGGAMYHGADDNASGTAVVAGLARAFAAAGGAPRTLVFALFGAEELGLVGSGHYVQHPSRPLAGTVGMVNFDMVGRLRDQLTVGGMDSATGLRDIVHAAANGERLAATLRGSPFSPSDHMRFYRAGVPVLFFHTGTHEDYHRPTDTPDKLDVAGMARIAAVGAQVIARLAAAPRAVYAVVPPPARNRRAGAFLGVQGGSDVDGARLVSIVPGTAADRAGLREGDVVIRLAGTRLASFDDLRAALRDRKVGERVDLVFVRNGEQRSVTATLDAAP